MAVGNDRIRLAFKLLFHVRRRRRFQTLGVFQTRPVDWDALKLHSSLDDLPFCFVVVVSVEIQPGFDARFFLPGGVVAALVVVVVVEKQRVHGASVQLAGENLANRRSDDVLRASSDDVVLSARRSRGSPLRTTIRRRQNGDEAYKHVIVKKN